jgi:hypothetical protein
MDQESLPRLVLNLRTLARVLLQGVLVPLKHTVTKSTYSIVRLFHFVQTCSRIFAALFYRILFGASLDSSI